ncbi:MULTISPECIES: protein phosphatase CheZ [Hydrocarboniphaga]|jgi:chemotaxis protein CheZ|uniref:Protein phosphatase CheZ n=1 Tax=Hydrocarboniphaga effusa AP103 TaxID=1172194 RepID=I8T459_9GAMM|nr:MULTISPECIES: protein phosphatase CheZ [Hydrocarboniphaga]EIT68458.1 hypothetical protein WQQ_36530 [Hydrocarboniphaga effusa AP103]MDZ4077930.1 protein phosphatase CheZ [Hydrocarboniphaga sp.]
MSANDQTRAAVELAAGLRAALAALEAGDEEAARALLSELHRAERHPLAQGVVRLAHEVSAAMRELDLDSRIAGLAQGEIKDACTHLDHVVRMTEDAAHRTLDLVEDSRRIVNDLHEAGGAPVADAVERLRSNLLSLALAQEYQDLSGQLIRRVIALVRQVESALIDLVRVAGPMLASAGEADLKNGARRPIETHQPSLPSESRFDLKGPAAANAASQQDADALLADLGF